MSNFELSGVHAPPVTTDRRPSMLIRFTHGLGDAVQLTCVLQHLARYQPEWEVDVAALVGKHSLFHGQCRNVYAIDRDPFDLSSYQTVRRLHWTENYTTAPGAPQSKVTKCLRTVFRLEVDESLMRYRINVRDAAHARAAAYLRNVTGVESPDGPFPAVCFHYEGNTTGIRKNLSHDTAARVCQMILARGYVPILLDWDGRSPLPNNRTIFCPGTYDGDLWGSTGRGRATHDCVVHVMGTPCFCNFSPSAP